MNVQETEKEILKIVIQREIPEAGRVSKTGLEAGGTLAENLTVTVGIGASLIRLKLLVLLAVLNVKSLSNRKTVDQSTVKNVIKSIDHQGDSNPGLSFWLVF